ncbi:MAG: DUF5055 domain-containing protein [Abditibacteriota bacterium]|nr:DUF5055 domain-containing protein [Abditibacteriota bacterium]
MADMLKVKVDVGTEGHRPHPLVVPLGEKLYRLDFTRATAQGLENAGFVLEQMTQKPATMVPLMAEHAFKAYHSLKPDAALSVFNRISNRRDVITALGEMYAETFTCFFTNDEEEAEEDETAEGNGEGAQEET